MKIHENKVGSANAEPKRANVKAENPDGSQVGAGVRGEHPPLVRQDGAQAPAITPTPSSPAEQPTSTPMDATCPTPSDADSQEPKKRDKSATDGTSSTRHVSPSKTVSLKQLEPNRKKSRRATGPTSEAGKRRASQNSYKEGPYAKRLFPTTQQWAVDGSDYQMISIGVNDYYKPVGFWESFWAEQIVTHALRYARGIGYQQRTLGSDYRFFGTSLNTSERHISAAFKHMLQAIKMLEAIQAKRNGDSGHPQPTGLDREPGADVSEIPISVPTESSGPEFGSADETEQPADSSDSDDTVDAGRSADEQDGHSFLYDGPPPDRAVVSPSQSCEGGANAGQYTGMVGTKRNASSQSDSKAGHVRKDTSEPSSVFADAVDKMMGWGKYEGTNPSSLQPQPSPKSVSQAETVPQQPQENVKDHSNERGPKSEPVPSATQDENVETNSKSTAKELAQADFKKDSK